MDQIITDLSDLRKYRHEMPNLADDSGLTPFQYRLLGHYKRVGTCTESVSTTAKKCKMSTGMVSQTRDELVTLGWISAREVPVLNGFSYEIKVVDRWLENFARYSKRSIDEIKRALDELQNEETPAGDNFRIYEQNIGPLTPLIADSIKAWEEELKDASWISEAIGEAVKNNKRNWKYCEAILKRWQTEGKDNGKKRQAGAGKKRGQPQPPARPQPSEEELEKQRKEFE